MVTVKISPKFQVVIPKSVREQMGLRPGQKVVMLPFGDRIELIPVGPIRHLRGFAKGIDTDVPREEEDRV